MNSRGIIVVSIIFTILISFLGLTLLTNSIFHNRIYRARTHSISKRDKIFQDLFLGLHNFRGRIFSNEIQGYKNPETDYFNKNNFPDSHFNTSQLFHSFAYTEIQNEYYRKLRIIDDISAADLKNNLMLKAEAVIKLITGRIPFTLFPFFLNKKNSLPPDLFQEEFNIKNKSNKNLVISEAENEFDVSKFLIDSLKIKGDIVNWKNIRERLGLEITDQPINDGIYLILEDDKIESVFIQGDVGRLVFQTDEDIQKIKITKAGVEYQLAYIPEGNYFVSWDNSLDPDLIFNQKIIINGNIWSLEQAGENAFLENSNIKLLVSGRTLIKTSLETKHIDQKNINFSNLTLISSKIPLFNQSTTKTEVIISEAENIKINLNLIVAGKFSNRSSKLEIHGSLYAQDFENTGTVEINHLISAFDSGKFFHTKDFIYLEDFIIDSIEEVRP